MSRAPIVEISEEALALGREMRQDGASWSRIARTLGAGVDLVRYRIDRGFAEKRLARVRNRRDRRPREPKLSAGPVECWVPPERLAQLLATVPRDDRNLTARLLGDPLRGRSALDQREISGDFLGETRGVACDARFGTGFYGSSDDGARSSGQPRRREEQTALPGGPPANTSVRSAGVTRYTYTLPRTRGTAPAVSVENRHG